MMLTFIVVFVISSWMVLCKHFDDGIIAKHLLSLASILAFLVILDNNNWKAAIVSVILLVIGVLYAHLRPTRRRPLFFDRRERQRPF